MATKKVTRFLPADRNANIAHGAARSRTARYGDVVDIDGDITVGGRTLKYADYVNERFPGEDGKPSLVSVAEDEPLPTAAAPAEPKPADPVAPRKRGYEG